VGTTGDGTRPTDAYWEKEKDAGRGETEQESVLARRLVATFSAGQLVIFPLLAPIVDATAQS
jgi:hypothetical protein